jgi:hypothetical protein
MRTSYVEEILTWRKNADEAIRRENSWLALAGLFWLEQGVNTVGSSPESVVRLPESAPGRIGEIKLEGSTASFRSAYPEIRANGDTVREAVLQPDTSGDPTQITLKDLTFILIERYGQFGVRLWDNGRAQRRSFPTRSWYPIAEKYRLSGRFDPYPAAKSTQMADISGSLHEGTVDGSVTFQLENRTFTLEASKSEEHELFIMFADLSNGKETYPPGRYLVAELDGDGNNVNLDFNKAYNPPCAFTDYATCLFAPEQNRLAVPMEAGELYAGKTGLNEKY